MNWLEIAALAILLLGIGAGGYLVAQRPTFWAGLAVVLITKAWPYISAYLAKRMTPTEEAEWRREVLAGRGDEWLRKRRGAPPKG